MEIAADLADFVEEDCKRLYPKLHDQAREFLLSKKILIKLRGMQGQSCFRSKPKWNTYCTKCDGCGANVLWCVVEIRGDIGESQ